jgi:hypothetical protein
MLLQTNSYIVPRDKRMEHARLLRRFRQVLLRLGCDHFEVYEQVGANWSSNETSGRFVQIMRFRDRKHQLAIQAAERADPTAQSLLKEFCELINLPYQQQQGLFAVGFYTSFLRMPQRADAPGASSQAAPEPPTQNEPLPHVEGSPSIVEGSPSTVEDSPSTLDAPEPPESIAMPGIAEESAGETEPGGLDVNAEPDTQSANASDVEGLPSTPLDSQSVFLPADDDDGSGDPGDPGQSSPGQGESAAAEKPTSPFSS